MSQSQTQPDFGIRVSVTGEIIPYAFTREETGEQIGLVHLRVPGDVVTLDVEPKVAERMREGEIWTVTGLCMVRKKAGRIHVHQPETLKRVRGVSSANGPTIDFGDEAPAARRSA